MKCPSCTKEIDHVVTSAVQFQEVCFQDGTNSVDNDTWKHVIDGDVMNAYCPECDSDIIDKIQL